MGSILIKGARNNSSCGRLKPQGTIGRFGGISPRSLLRGSGCWWTSSSEEWSTRKSILALFFGKSSQKMINLHTQDTLGLFLRVSLLVKR